MEKPPDIRRIDLEAWPRREAYDLFRGFGFPYFSITAEVDVTELRRIPKELRGSFSVALVYVLAHAANDVPEFRQRMRGDEVIEHPVVHPSITVLGEDHRFRFCTLAYSPEVSRFTEEAAARIEAVKQAASLWSEPDRDDFLFFTAIPWVSFTAFVHPAPIQAPDSVPRIAWGRYVDRGGRVVMPLNVQVHHALIDGVHVGRFYERVQELLLDAAGLFGPSGASSRTSASRS
jgi:chloramphenicol O-acetyltransferase